MLAGVMDTNAAIGLAKGGVFNLLRDLYAPLYVPTAVTAEVLGADRSRPGAKELADALGVWIVEVAPDPATIQQFTATLAIADHQVLAVALEKSVDHILSSDERLRREAQHHRRVCFRTSEVVVLMKRRQQIAEVRSVLDLMRQQGYGITDDLYDQALVAAGE